jgi:hypothetical protein
MGLFGDIVGDVKRQRGLWLRYPPAEPVALGDVIVRDEGLWVRVGNIADDLGFEIERTDPYEEQDMWVCQSESGVSVVGKASTDASDALSLLADGEVGAYVHLSSGGKYLLSLRGVTFTSVKSVDGFWDQIKQHRRMFTWDRRRKIVTTVVRAGSGTFLMSADSEVTYGLKARASIPTTTTIVIADLAAGFDLAKRFSAADCFVAKAGFTPLFRAHKVTLFGGSKLAALGETRLEPDDED